MRSFAAAAAALAVVPLTQAWNIQLPPCLEEFKPFVKSGCYSDSTGEALVYRANGDKHTVETCVAECKGNGFRYAGLKYYGICFCGATVNGPQVDDSKCSFPCEANKSEICGGNDELSIWQDPTFPKGPDDTTVDSYKSLGCYTDKGPGRTLSWDSKADAATLTTKSCLAACEKKGYPYAGTEFGDECYCGSVLANNTAKTDDAECNSPCAGDASEKCGGRNALNLYVATDLESLEPCGYKPHTTTTTATTKSGFSTTTRRSHTTTTTTTTRHSQESTTTTRTRKTTTTTTSKPSQESTTTTRTRKTTTSTTSRHSQETTTTTTTKPSHHSTTTRTRKTTTTTTTKPSHHSTTSKTRETTTTTTTTKPSHHSTTSKSRETTTTTTKPSHHSTTSKSRETTTTTTTKPSHHSTTSKSRETTTTTTTTKPSHHSTTSKSRETTTTTTTTKPSHHSTTSKTRQTTTTKSTTTTKGSHTTTTTTAVCTATHTSPPKCEWQIGDWCAPPLPDWDNKLECLVAAKTCELQGVSCFAKAGFPHVIDCFKFTKWCIAVKAHCVTDCVLQKGCGKRECWDKNKPGPGTPPSTSTSVYPCPPSTTLKPTTTTKPPVTTSCAPEPTNICTQPTNDKWGYGPGKPVGGIPLPAVCCNDIKDDFNKNPFKLYNDPDSKKCPSFPWPSRPNVCQDACKEQYEDCRNTYVTGCKTLGRKRSIGLSAREAEATSAQDVEFERRWLLSWSSGDQASCSSTGNAGSWGGKGSDSPSCWGKGGNTPDKALQRCKAQYDDCMVVNKKVDPGDKCRTWCDKN
ncbi:putative glyoxal oxidase precursor [Purpureocillium lilacinum]|uniref:Putative glyoxal oxidase n=1 Tax=Purpureocillium lilacinum TaxID=33203 RepID=A0A2U3EK05_PURLI|nr:putative glyoxal oxidase precursor [Purpureocillium lilacinum]